LKYFTNIKEIFNRRQKQLQLMLWLVYLNKKIRLRLAITFIKVILINVIVNFLNN
jgi:hypothetical protein